MPRIISSKTVFNSCLEQENKDSIWPSVTGFLDLPDINWCLGLDFDNGNSLVYHALHQPPLLRKDFTSNLKGLQNGPPHKDIGHQC